MKNQNVEENDPQIKEVLKALNHTLRREILLYLKGLNREASFSELMDYCKIDSKVSGQFSYHVKLLQQSNLISKTNDKYLITPLGVKATSMLDVTSLGNNEDSILQKISKSFKNITSFDQIVLSFHAFCFIAFILPFVLLLVNYNRFHILLMPMLLGLVLLIFIIIFSYLKLKYIPSVLILFSVIWIIFLSHNQKKIAFIYTLTGIDIVFLYNAVIGEIIRKNSILFRFFMVMTPIFIIASILAVGYTLYKEYGIKQIT